MTFVILAITQPVTVGIVVFFVLHYLSDRDARDNAERQVLLQRIQAPESAVVEHSQAAAAPDLPAVNPFDDEDFARAHKEMAEMEDKMQKLAL